LIWRRWSLGSEEKQTKRKGEKENSEGKGLGVNN